MIDYEKMLSNRVLSVKPSGIRRFFDIANEMKDVISLGVGEPDFQTPWSIREAGIRSLEKGKTLYTSNWGLMELRREISKYMLRRFELEYKAESEIIVTVGGSEAIDICIRCLVDEGDEVLVPEPCFVAYAPIATLSGGVVVPIVTREEDNFRLTAMELKKKITPKTKLLILPFPNNPTGGVMRRDDLLEIAEVLRGTDIIVLSDEIYAELTYGSKHVSIATINDMKERTVIINGFSKSFAMTGWRLGFACGPSEIIDQMVKIHQFAIMSAPTTSQYAAIEALKSCEENINNMVEEYDQRRRFLVDGFRKIGLSCFEPEGAFYVFPCIRSTGLTSEEFCEKLLFSKFVAVVPGNAFGDCGEGFIRVSYSYSVNHIKEALKRIEEFLLELNK